MGGMRLCISNDYDRTVKCFGSSFCGFVTKEDSKAGQFWAVDWTLSRS